jgi:hypothetical protein
MHFELQRTADDLAGQRSLLTLALVSFLVGTAAGLVAALFRGALDQLDRFRDGLLAWAHGEALAGFCSLPLHVPPCLRLRLSWCAVLHPRQREAAFHTLRRS